MIKVGITGAESPVAGELLRILINHPEVDITTLLSSSLAGRPVTAAHHGFIGENIVRFSDRLDPSKLDVIFITDKTSLGNALSKNEKDYPDLKIIDVSPMRGAHLQDTDFEYGLSEINRKALVRGASKAVVTSIPAAGILIALYPLASYLLLQNDIDIEISGPSDVIDSIDESALIQEISNQLKKVQSSFNSNIRLHLKPFNTPRIIRSRISFNCQLSLEEIGKIYDAIYDDHNFTFTTVSEITGREIEGTQKCIITYKKPEPIRLN